MNFITTVLANHKVAHTLQNIYLRKIKRISFKVKKVNGSHFIEWLELIYLAENSTEPI
jgi:hypothetical protein